MLRKLLCFKNEDEETGNISVAQFTFNMKALVASPVLQAKLKVGKASHAIRYLQANIPQILFVYNSNYYTKRIHHTHKYSAFWMKKKRNKINILGTYLL